MSETTGALRPESLARKKVLGVPALYLAGGFVVVLAIIAWRAKTTKAVDTAATATTTPVATLGGDLYPTMPQGTVIVAPATGGLAGTNSSITTNDSWVKAGMVSLAKLGYSPGTAQLALQAYLNGDQLSVEQGKMRDSAISANGAPPVLTSVGGIIPSPPVIPSTPVNTPATVPANSELILNNNRAWQNALINKWAALGANPLDMQTATSQYLAGQPINQAQANGISQLIGIYGAPPEGTAGTSPIVAA